MNKRNPTDLTRRNLTAQKTRDARLRARLEDAEWTLRTILKTLPKETRWAVRWVVKQVRDRRPRAERP